MRILRSPMGSLPDLPSGWWIKESGKWSGMQRVFFITGLPRTRTAWLAAFLSCGPVQCMHDALAQCEAPMHLPDLLMRRVIEANTIPGNRCQAVGNADSSLLVFWEEVFQRFPGAHWIHIMRPRTEAQVSFWNHFGPHYPGGPQSFDQLCERFFRLEEAEQKFRAAAGQLNCTQFGFFDLDVQSQVHRIWDICSGGLPFPAERWAMFNQMRINLVLEKVPMPKFIKPQEATWA